MIPVWSRVTSMVAQNGQETRVRDLTRPLPSQSKECEESRTNSPGSLLHGRPGGRQRVSGVATRWVSPLKAGSR